MQTAPKTVLVSMTVRRYSAWAIATGAAPTSRTLTAKNQPVVVSDAPQINDTAAAATAPTTTSVAMRNSTRPTREAISAASKVRPSSATVITRIAVSGGVAAMKTYVVIRSTNNVPNRFGGTRRSSHASIGVGVDGSLTALAQLRIRGFAVQRRCQCSAGDAIDERARLRLEVDAKVWLGQRHPEGASLLLVVPHEREPRPHRHHLVAVGNEVRVVDVDAAVVLGETPDGLDVALVVAT